MSNSADWYARKLGAPRPQSAPPTQPASPQVYIPQQQQPNVPVQYDSSQDQLTISRAISSRMTEVCDACGSGNYFAPLGTQRKRCYDCGYPVVQQGSGLAHSSTGNGGAVKAAKQVGQSDGFNPHIIVDRIG
mgnify:FL=1